MSRPARSWFLAWALPVAALSGAAWALAAPPVGWAWLGWVHLAPALVGMALAQTPWRRGLVGYTTGAGLLVAVCAWMPATVERFAGLPPYAAVAVLALYVAVFALPWAGLGLAIAPLRARFGAHWVWAAAVVWVALEYLLPSTFRFFLGSVHYREPWVWQLAAVVGPLGVSALAVSTAAALAELVLARRERRGPPVATGVELGAVWAATLAFGAWREATVEAGLARSPVVRVAYVQRAELPPRRERGMAALRDWARRSRAVLAAQPPSARPELVVWPESAFLPNPAEGEARRELAAFAAGEHVALLLGAGTTEPGRETNSVYLFLPDGTVGGRYDKQALLPFAEGVPSGLGWARAWVPQLGALAAGEETVVFAASSFTFTAPICYEAVLAEQVRAMDDADLLVNVTNDAWFGASQAPHLHAMLAAAAAMTSGRPLLRVAYTGASGLVEPHGAIVQPADLGTDAGTVVAVRLGAVEAPARTWGAGFGPGAVVIAAGLVFASAHKRSG